MSFVDEEKILVENFKDYLNTITFSPAITFISAQTNRNAFKFQIPSGKLDCFGLKIGIGTVGLEAGRNRIFDINCFLVGKFTKGDNAYIFWQAIIDLLTRKNGWKPDNKPPLPNTEINSVNILSIGEVLPAIDEFDENNELANEFYIVEMELKLKITGLRPVVIT